MSWRIGVNELVALARITEADIVGFDFEEEVIEIPHLPGDSQEEGNPNHEEDYENHKHQNVFHSFFLPRVKELTIQGGEIASPWTLRVFYHKSTQKSICLNQKIVSYF